MTQTMWYFFHSILHYDHDFIDIIVRGGGVKWEAEYENRRRTLRPLLKKNKEYDYHNL